MSCIYTYSHVHMYTQMWTTKNLLNVFSVDLLTPNFAEIGLVRVDSEMMRTERCEAYVILWVGIWWVLLWCGCIELVIIVLCDFVYFVIAVCMCGFCTVWMCEAYVILWVGIWWVTAFLDYTD